MDELVQIITTLISNVGFPIACVCVMFYMQYKEREAHKSETAELATAIQNNTVVMEKILTKLEDMGA